MHLVVRKWANAAALADKMQERQDEVNQLLRGIPGFVAYYATRDGSAVTSVSVYETSAGTRESTRVAGEWVKQNLPGAAIGAPEVTEGETFLNF